jgi:hypothetical protein
MQDNTIRAVHKALIEAVPSQGSVDILGLAIVATQTLRKYREDMTCGLNIDQLIWLIDDYRERTGLDVDSVPTRQSSISLPLETSAG